MGSLGESEHRRTQRSRQVGPGSQSHNTGTATIRLLYSRAWVGPAPVTRQLQF